MKRQEKKKETIPKIGINFLRDLCPEAVIFLYAEIKKLLRSQQYNLKFLVTPGNFQLLLQKFALLLQ